MGDWSAWSWALIGAGAVLLYMVVAKFFGRDSKRPRPVNAVNPAMIGQPCPKCGHYIGSDYKCDNPICGYDLFTADLPKTQKKVHLFDESDQPLPAHLYGMPAAPIYDLSGRVIGQLDPKDAAHVEGSMDIIKRGECPDCGSRLDTRQVCTNPACGLDWSHFYFANSPADDEHDVPPQAA